jgi:hypothetical protein
MITPESPNRQLIIGAISAVVAVALLIVFTGGTTAPRGTALALPTAVVTHALPTATSHTPEPVASDPRPALPSLTTAYAEPNGTALGALERGRRYIAVARSGEDWTQIDAEGSGRVWVPLRLGDRATLPDLTPAQPAPPAPRAVAPTMVYRCEAGIPGQMVSATSTVSYDDCAANAAALWKERYP